MSGTNEKILSMANARFSTEKATPEKIREFIEVVAQLFPDDQIDKRRLFELIESEQSVSLTDDVQILDGQTGGHIEWFNPVTNVGLHREVEWRFWLDYKRYLIENKGRNRAVVNSLDSVSSDILCRLEDPLRDGSWDRRGMVVGSVQAGKTANYTAVISKAADAGYKLIIVLAGVHNSLRSQTQDRINEEFLGMDFDLEQQTATKVGVGAQFPGHPTAYTLTSSADHGDFSAAFAKQIGVFPSSNASEPPIILVVKKHVSILENVIKWATTLAKTNFTNKKIVSDVPLLLIDDECDFASVNTKKKEVDEFGNVCEEWDPTTTNRKIRTLLNRFAKSAYIGYTATPYANIFIYMDDPHPVYGEDLFPRSFLIDLPQPDNYLGPRELFGIEGDGSSSSAGPLPLVKKVKDFAKIFPDGHKKDLNVPNLPASLVKALKCFVLACAARRIRSMGVPHNSMLIHVTRFTRVQGQIIGLVVDEIRELTARIMSGSDPLDDLRKLWETDFSSTSIEMDKRGFSNVHLHDWDDIDSQLMEAVRGIKVKGINGEVGDTLDYKIADQKTKQRQKNGEDVPWVERGISEIAIGGDKLSRGLTLEGLSISYYLRASKMYDTLMQMGRWFGYRDHYNDLCRIFTSRDLIEWYRFIALANVDLGDQFRYMAATNATPEEFGLKVRHHPGQLMVTGAGKRRSASKERITFSGDAQQTIVFDPAALADNYSTLKSMLQSFGRAPDRTVNPSKPRFQWEGIESSQIIDFLLGYKTHDTAKKVVDPVRHAEYIRAQVRERELESWTVVLVSNIPEISPAESPVSLLPGIDIFKVNRKALHADKERVSIGTLLSPKDEALDMEGIELAGAALRAVRDPGQGLLLIYLPASDGKRSYGLGEFPFVGYVLSFPKSPTATGIEYLLGPVAQGEKFA